MSNTRNYEQRYSLAQYARRVGLSEGRARALYSHADGSRLATADGTDPDGKPFWYAATIDAWCQQTQRRMPEDARWPYHWPAATAPAPEIERTDVTITSDSGRTARVSVIVWDAPLGHVVYVMRHADQPDLSKETAARAAAYVLQPAFWAEAIVLVPEPRLFGSAYPPGSPGNPYESIDAYQLVVPDAGSRPQPAAPTRRLPRFLAALLDDPDPAVPAAAADPDRVVAKSVSYPYAHAIEQVLGRPLPVWFYGTCTAAAVQRMLAYGDTGATFTVPDTATSWPATCERLTAAVDAGMPQRYPQAFALLAQAVLSTLAGVRRDHASARERGDGWYIVARPADPGWPVALEALTAGAAETPFDAVAAAAELPRIRAEEADLPWDDLYAEALYDTAGVIGARLRTSHPEVVFTADTVLRVDTAGPVTDQYLSTLTPLTEDEREHPTRRLARLLCAETNIDAIREHRLLDLAQAELEGLYRDQAGRLVARERPAYGDDSIELNAEWPTALPQGWTERTVIAADPHRPALVVALTPTSDGDLHVDPLPNPGGEPGYTWGYSGSGPRTLYQALVRCATGDFNADPDNRSWLADLTDSWHDTTGSPLYHYLVTLDGPLRLSWPQVQQWVRADLESLNPPETTAG
ncbi:hypothetical protein [Actinoplanes cyaneus]|uniref:hypothetical protein n=1 Tax=Actinoplanes cyaneus TaxID=52696 RepID=UPI0019447F07|nr:hypothetical protein [Actinoplanes cyaneus]MCW2144343.1 hypothetical protein [Actinoplanes cyaneus]